MHVEHFWLQKSWKIEANLGVGFLKNGPNPASFCLFSLFSYIARTNIAQIWPKMIKA